jgi:cytochrome c-type biogenesis protein CcmH/NrfG
MAQALQDQQVTPADELRELLVESEERVVNLPGSGAKAVKLLENMDRMAELWPQLEAAGVDLRPEEGRWETLQATLRKHGSQVVAELRAIGGLPRLRAERYPDGRAGWWWYLPEQIRADRRQRVRTFALGAVALVAVGALIVFLLNKLLPVDPKLKASLSKQMAGQQKIERDQDYTGALEEFKQAVAAKPDEPDAWLWLGAVQQKLGDAKAAQASFERARALLGNEINFRLARVPVYQFVGLLAEAEADIKAVLAADPENPQAYYFYATILETQGRYEEAATALQRASDLADARKQPEITALARYRLAILLQQIQTHLSPEPTPTPQ